MDKKKYLAVGVDADNGLFMWSAGTDSADPETVFKELKKSSAGGEEDSGNTPEQILLIEATDVGPVVVQHWNDGVDFNQQKE